VILIVLVIVIAIAIETSAAQPAWFAIVRDQDHGHETGDVSRRGIDGRSPRQISAPPARGLDTGGAGTL